MIEVTNRRYAGRTALSGISFSVGKGEIAGLLACDGAQGPSAPDKGAGPHLVHRSASENTYLTGWVAAP
jgi:hypothetical protein